MAHAISIACQKLHLRLKVARWDITALCKLGHEGRRAGEEDRRERTVVVVRGAAVSPIVCTRHTS